MSIGLSLIRTSSALVGFGLILASCDAPAVESCAPILEVPAEPSAEEIEQAPIMARHQRFERIRVQALNCMAEEANRQSDPVSADAVLGACDDLVQPVLALSEAAYWAADQYEPTVSEQLSVRADQLERLSRIAVHYSSMRGSRCSSER